MTPTKAERTAILDYAMSVVQLAPDGTCANWIDAIQDVQDKFQISAYRATGAVSRAVRRMRHEMTPAPGRPATMADGETVAIYLPSAMIAKARRLGEGNISAGVRRCIEAHDELDDDSL